MLKQITSVCALLFWFFLLACCSKRNTVSASKSQNLFNKSSNETELLNTPQLNFRLNVSQVTNKQNFRAICLINRWQGASRKDYAVHFYRTNGDDVDKELVGTYEVYGKSIFKI